MFSNMNIVFYLFIVKMMLTIKKNLQTTLKNIKKYHCLEITIVNILIIYITYVFIKFYISGIKLFMLFPNPLFLPNICFRHPSKSVSIVLCHF